MSPWVFILGPRSNVAQVSITFDPFMYLTLPLPVQKKWRHPIFYVPWDSSKPHLKVCQSLTGC